MCTCVCVFVSSMFVYVLFLVFVYVFSSVDSLCALVYALGTVGDVMVVVVTTGLECMFVCVLNVAGGLVCASV